ncbi:MAG: hypothetical protein GXP22_06000 [Gammaproteobacteria bacterium]|nr:hypothetical protein [Gammaproteobacteria bacterium]
MMKSSIQQSQELRLSSETLAAEPLHRRVPMVDENGKPLSDFMMFIPKLRSKPAHIIQQSIARIERVLKSYPDVVVFADLNLKINVLWVSIRPIPGMFIELPSQIKKMVPEAILVSHPDFSQ